MIANSTAYRTDTKGSPQAAHFFIYILLTSAVPDATHAWLVMDLYDCNYYSSGFKVVLLFHVRLIFHCYFNSCVLLT